LCRCGCRAALPALSFVSPPDRLTGSVPIRDTTRSLDALASGAFCALDGVGFHGGNY